MKKILTISIFLVCVAANCQVTPTPNLGLTLPPYNTANWNTIVNNNFSLIDTAVGSLQSSFQGSWSYGVSYSKGQIVSYSGSFYQSLINNNMNNTPSSNPLSWILFLQFVNSINGSSGSFTFGGSGVVCAGTTCTFSSSSGVNTVSSFDGSLVVSPTSGSVLTSLNTSHANNWSAIQTFGTNISIAGVTPTGATGTGNLAFSSSPTFTGTLTASGITASGTATFSGIAGASTYCVQVSASGVLSNTGTACGSGGGGVSSVSGDGALISNVSSTGNVILSLSSAGAGTVWGNAGISSGTPAYITNPVLGVAGTTLGTIGFHNATSGTLTLQPTTGALGTITATFPANTGTVAETNLAQTWTATQTFVAPALGTPVSGVITNLTGTCTSCIANTAGAISTNGTANQVWATNTSGTAQGWETVAALSATAYGATGTGTMSGNVISGTDDTTALQNWINACATTGLSCYLPSPGRGKCYRFTHLYLDNLSGRNSGWPAQEVSLNVYGDGMDVPSSMQGRIFLKSTLCSTDTTDPAIQVGLLSSAASGSYPQGAYHIHDLNVIQVGATASVPVIGMNQVTQHVLVENIQIDQVGTGSGLIWSNLWNGSGVRNSTIFTEQTSPVSGTHGLWLYNNDPSAIGGAQVFADKVQVGNVLSGTSGFDRGIQIGVVSSGGLLTADTIVGSVQSIGSMSMSATSSQGNNYEYIFAGGVDGLHMDSWASENGLLEGIVLCCNATQVEISNGQTNEGNLASTHPAEVYIDTGSGGVAAPGNGIRIINNQFNTVAVNGIYSPNMGFESGELRLNRFNAKTNVGSTCINTFGPTPWTEWADGCVNFGTLSTDSTSWVGYNINNAGSYAPTFKGTLTLTGITGSTQCLQVNSSGAVSGTGAGCGSSGGITGATNGQPLTATGSTTATSRPIYYDAKAQGTTDITTDLVAQYAVTSSANQTTQGNGYTGTQAGSVNPFNAFSATSDIAITTDFGPYTINANAAWTVVGNDVLVRGHGQNGNSVLTLNNGGSFPANTTLLTIGNNTNLPFSDRVENWRINCGTASSTAPCVLMNSGQEGTGFRDTTFIGTNGSSASSPVLQISGTNGSDHGEYRGLSVLNTGTGNDAIQFTITTGTNSYEGNIISRLTGNNTSGSHTGNACIHQVGTSFQSWNYVIGMHCEDFTYGVEVGNNTGIGGVGLEATGTLTDVLHIDTGGVVGGTAVIDIRDNSSSVTNLVNDVPNGRTLTNANYTFAGGHFLAGYFSGTTAFGGLNYQTNSYSSAHTANINEFGIVSTAAMTLTVPHALTMQYWHATNESSGTLTLACDTGNINGGATVTMAQYQQADVWADGTNCWAGLPGTGGGSVSLTSSAGTLTLSPSPITGTGTLDINLGNANTWTALQTFGTHISIGGVTASGATGTGNVVFATSPTFTGTVTLPAVSATSATFTGSGIPIATGTSSNSDLAGFITLSGGTGTYTFSATYVTSPVCVATDTTATNAVQASTTTTVLTINGTSTDVIAYHCIGRT